MLRSFAHVSCVTIISIFVASCSFSPIVPTSTFTPTTTTTSTYTLTSTFTPTDTPTFTPTEMPPQYIYFCFNNQQTILMDRCITSSGTSTGEITHFYKGNTLKYEYKLNGDIHGSNFTIGLIIGVPHCHQDSDMPIADAKIIISKNGHKESVASTTFYTWCQQPRLIEQTVEGLDPETEKGDLLIFEITNNSDNNIEMLFESFNKKSSTSYLIVPAIY